MKQTLSALSVTNDVPHGALPVASLYELPDLSILTISGVDAVSFIQGQVTNDIAGADLGSARLAGYCTAQGRLLATMVLTHMPAVTDAAPALSVLIRKDIVESVVKRLKMFVMRAKVNIAESTMVVSGVSTTQEHVVHLETLLGHALPAPVWQTQHHTTGIWIAAPRTAAQPTLLRWWWLTNPTQSISKEGLSNTLALRPASAWQAQDIEAGLPWVSAATQDMFIPQTLNLDLIEGVSFTKGCYPGQEIVARSHYRGTVKRRMALGTIDAEANVASEWMLPGTDIFDRSREDQACGRIVNIATVENTIFVLFEASFEAVDHAALCVASATGPALTIHRLPYATRPIP